MQPKSLWISEGQAYIRGLSLRRNADRTFKICRARDPVVQPEDFDPDGITADRYEPNRDTAWSGAPVEVRVRLTGRGALLGSEHKLVATQREFELPGPELLVIAESPGLQAALWWVLRWGSQAEVLHPPELVDLVRAEVEEVRGFYLGGG